MRLKTRSANPGESDTLYRQVEQAIYAEISAGKFKPGDHLGSTEDLAVKWDVSPSTIRQSLQMLASRGVVIRKPRVGTIVAPGFRDPGPSGATAPAPATVRPAATPMAVLLLPDIEHPEYASLARAMQDVAHRSGMDMVIGSTDDDVERYEEIITRQLKNDLFGMVLVPPMRNQLPLPVLSKVQSKPLPVVSVYRRLGVPDWPMVCTDYYHSTYIATQHLCEVGCQRLAYCGHIESPFTFDRPMVKHYAFLRGLLANGRTADVPEPLLLPPGKTADSASSEENDEIIERWLRIHPEVDGVCCGHDDIAYLVLRTLSKLGRRVPEDVAVVGDGGHGQFLGYDPQALSTVDMCMDDIAAACWRLLEALSTGQTVAPLTEVRVKGKLIQGQSTRRHVG